MELANLKDETLFIQLRMTYVEVSKVGSNELAI
jgi:hypothetical protein